MWLPRPYACPSSTYLLHRKPAFLPMVIKLTRLSAFEFESAFQSEQPSGSSELFKCLGSTILLMDGPHAKCSLCDTYLCMVAMPQFCITQCLGCLPPKGCIPQCFQEILQESYSDHSIPLSGPAAAAELPDLFTIFWRCLNLSGCRLQT